MLLKVRWFAAAIGVVAAVIGLSVPALAHTGDAAGVVGGFVSGFTHPIFGWDHVIAMVAVGMWGAFLGPPAIWVLPVVFPLVMAFGGALGVLGVPLPAVELGIAASAVVLGLLIAFAVRSPLWVAAIVVGGFAIFHGHALPTAASPLVYSLGFVIATGLLHLLGIAFGLLIGRPAGAMAVRTGGAAIAVAGLAFLMGFV
jgi:urease accessory protein